MWTISLVKATRAPQTTYRDTGSPLRATPCATRHTSTQKLLTPKQISYPQTDVKSGYKTSISWYQEPTEILIGSQKLLLQPLKLHAFDTKGECAGIVTPERLQILLQACTDKLASTPPYNPLCKMKQQI
eukprot:45450-Pelagomonas_calceolata.AAC.1